MTVLVVGATGATGRLLVNHLLGRDINVKIIVRSTAKINELFPDKKLLTIIQGNVLEMNKEEISECTKDCDAICSCLGHNLTWKGIFGKPHLLVTETARLLCNSIENNNQSKTVKYVLMNTIGNKNLHEKISIPERIIMFLIRNIIPPQKDNEQAADFLRSGIGTNNRKIEWAVVRPDTLVNEVNVSEYEIFESPTRSKLFNAGKTSRVNVGHFMAELVADNDIWNKWKFRMPVIYNKETK